MRGNPDMHYGAFTSYVIEEEGGKWFTNAYPWLKKKKKKILMGMITAGGVKIREKIDYLIYKQSRIFKSFLMNSSMKFMLALIFLVLMVKRY